ncbi:hypothetical protein XENOCAPTIV_029018 [Xenoophorus captivus]|uniref:Uncharacterized protein n=1 Tax=Xenoophorus captivus TaxID=1517983 RepID=A0ABV0SD08_9TELE
MRSAEVAINCRVDRTGAVETVITSKTNTSPSHTNPECYPHPRYHVMSYKRVLLCNQSDRAHPALCPPKQRPSFSRLSVNTVLGVPYHRVRGAEPGGVGS